ncbi:MAG: nicotinate-nicotinamide nucleotide adenylyltransferase [Christensenellales bacterium]|jgi:nicotinate (nicotinamide) nucleotide adenylyltransferase
MDIAVLGGTFAPPTMAHVRLLRAGMEFTGAQIGVWAPSSVSYMRRWRAGRMPDRWFSDDARRAEMLRALCAAEGDMRLYADEMAKRDGAYTYDTLYALEQLYGGAVYFVMGSDLLPSLPGWHRARELIARFPIVVASRGEGEASEAIARAGLPGVREMPFPDVYRERSATQVREMIRAGRLAETKPLLHPAVYRYIEENWSPAET